MAKEQNFNAAEATLQQTVLAVRGLTVSQTGVVSASAPSTPVSVDPSVPPDASTTNPPIPIPHTSIGFTPPVLPIADANDTAATRSQVLVWYGWQDVGTLVTSTPTFVEGGTPANPAPAVTLLPVSGAPFPQVTQTTPLLVEDAVGNGAAGTLDATQTLTLTDPVPILYSPLRALFNLLPVTRGKTVANEVLGNGNAAVAGQDFTLQNTPVTYLQDPASISGDNYSSTIRIWVNQLEWKEARSFYGQLATAQIFVTKEDEQGNTHVLFGDGEHGARLPTGVNNVIAKYRYGSGALAPDAGSVSVVLQPQPGLRAIHNPVQVGGGSDPDLPAKIRQLAPKSVLTFDRAVSAEDYETIAAQAPSVARARAYFTFDADVQRPRIKVYVGDNAAAVAAARAAIASAADPNRLPGVVPATPIVVTIGLTLVIDPRAVPAVVIPAVHAALLDPDTGLLGVNAVGIGEAFYDSQIYAACLAVPGVVAVNNYSFDPPMAVSGTFSSCQCQHRHDPGEGGYFSLPDDGAHLNILPALTS